jgi:hypothetical protein
MKNFLLGFEIPVIIGDRIFFFYHDPQIQDRADYDDLVKSPQNDGFVKSSPATGGTRRA